MLNGMDDLGNHLKKYQPAKRNPNLHSELHALVEEARALFGETAVKGPGSFSFYLGFFKRLGKDKVYQLLSEIKDSKDITTPGKLFWWKIKEELKKK
jgi:hypothetical protein